MTTGITAPLENYLYAAGVVIVVAWIAVIYSGLARPVKRRGPWTATRKTYYRPAGRWTNLNVLPVDGAEQLRAVMAGRFEKQRLLNAGEYRVFKTIEDCVESHRRGYRVFAQANLGEILDSRDEQAFRAINSKRVDILIVDQGSWPVLAVEFQGGGHYQGTAAIRDAVKKLNCACRSASAGSPSCWRLNKPNPAVGHCLRL
jgi:hypothetical protein